MDSTLKNSSTDGEWTQVVSRRARGISKPRTGLQEEKVQPRRSNDLTVAAERQKPRQGQGERTPNPKKIQDVRVLPNPSPKKVQEVRVLPIPSPKKVQEVRVHPNPNPRKVGEVQVTPNPNPRQAVQQEQRWIPRDVEFDPERQAILLQKMESAIWKLRRSNFYTTFFDQLKSPEVSEQFRLLLGSETQLQMVIYGLGRIEQNRADSKIQLSMALSMKRELNWIGEIQVFDSSLSATECSVIETLGCTVLSVNEYARREALKPTLFFMPCRNPIMYRNLLQANWHNGGLSKMVLLGNSFKNYKEESWYRPHDHRALEHIVDARGKITREFPVERASDDLRAFEGLSWHFFSPGVDNSDRPVFDFGLFPPLI